MDSNRSPAGTAGHAGDAAQSRKGVGPALGAGFSHVGLSVPDIEEAVRWYRDILGFRVLVAPRSVDDTSPVAAMARDIYGPQWHAMFQAHLSSANGIGLELFQFVVPAESRPEHGFEYWRSGIFHVSVVSGDVPALANRISRSGGRRRTEIYEPQPGFAMCYCEDPWGNAVEINSLSYELAHPIQVL